MLLLFESQFELHLHLFQHAVAFALVVSQLALLSFVLIGEFLHVAGVGLQLMVLLLQVDVQAVNLDAVLLFFVAQFLLLQLDLERLVFGLALLLREFLPVNVLELALGSRILALGYRNLLLQF